ncbi:MAG TPA: flavodoxin family protein [Deltaproteobacteria bacterium]|nr:flavodoxin family protein [Deltaproteobacteria bacterium]
MKRMDKMNGKAKTPPKVLVLLGSPRRKGNSTLLAQRIAKGAEKAGASVEYVYLHGLDIRACTGCMKCQRKGAKGCVIKDDMQDLYRLMKECDAWVVASPVYWFTVSAQLKLWMDRCLAFTSYTPDAFSGKRIAIAMTYGGEDPFDSGCINALRTFQDAYSYVGARIVGMVYGSAMAEGEIAKDAGVLSKAEDLGHLLVAADG